MSLLDGNSDFAVNAGIDLFHVPPTDASLKNVVYEDFRSISSFENSNTINFIIPAQSEKYIDLASTTIHLRLKIEKADGTQLEYINTNAATLKASDEITFINNTAQSMWSYIDVHLNDEQLSIPNSHSHPYQAFLQRYLHENINVQNSISEQAFYYREDTADRKKFSRTIDGNDVEIIDTLAIDIFQQPRLLLPGVSLKLSFHKASDNFVLLNLNIDKNDESYKIIIDDIFLRLKKVEILTDIRISHEKMLSQNNNAKYLFNKYIYKYYQIPSGVTSKAIENVFTSGSIPDKFAFVFIDTEAYFGNKNKDPFFFNNFDIGQISVYINDQMITHKPLKMNFKVENDYLMAYNNTISNLGMTNETEWSNGYTMKDFKKGKTIFFFNSTPNPEGDLSYLNLVKEGTVRIELTFNTPLKSSIIVVIVAVEPKIFEINQKREILIQK